MSTNTAAHLVQIPHSSGVELNGYLLLKSKPMRVNQKLQTLRKYVKQYSSGWKKRLELADLLYETGNWEQASKEYRLVIERQPQLIDVRLKLAKLLQLMGRKVEAIQAYKYALLFAENLATQYHINGWIDICKGDKLEAIQAFESATSLEPNHPAHWLALGQVQLELENAVAAWQAFKEILSLNPGDIVALISGYDANLALGNLRAARKLLRRATELAPDDYQVLKRLVEYRCRMQLVWDKPGEQTANILSTALKLAPDAPDSYKLLSDYYIARGELAKGIELLQQYTEQHPNNPHGWFYYGWVLFQVDDNQEAALAMLKAYQLYPNDCEIYRVLCEILPAAGRLEELRPLLEEMLVRFSESWSIWATVGRVLVEQFQEIERGCDFALKGTQLQPQLPDPWFRYGRVLSLAGKHREAVAAFEQGWEWLKEGWISLSVPAAVWLYESYRVLGDEAESRKWLEEARERLLQLMEFDPAMADYWQERLLEGSKSLHCG